MISVVGEYAIPPTNRATDGCGIGGIQTCSNSWKLLDLMVNLWRMTYPPGQHNGALFKTWVPSMLGAFKPKECFWKKLGVHQLSGSPIVRCGISPMCWDLLIPRLRQDAHVAVVLSLSAFFLANSHLDSGLGGLLALAVRLPCMLWQPDGFRVTLWQNSGFLFKVMCLKYLGVDFAVCSKC